MFVLWAALAMAEDMDFSKQAAERMNLSFDLEEVEAQLNQPARARRAAPPQAAAAYDNGGYPGPGWTQAPLPLEANSKIEAVTVLVDRALVERVRTVDVPAGESTVVFEGLPLALLGDQVYARIRSGKAQVVGLEVDSGAGKVDEAKVEALKKEMLAMTAELGSIRDHIEGLLAQRTYLRTTLLAPPPDGAPGPTLNQLRDNFAYVGDAEARIAKTLREDEEKAQKLDEKLRPFLVKLVDANATGRVVKVVISASAPTSLEVGLRYGVAGASWSPTYNARLDPAKNTVGLEVLGVVTQNTGESWKDVALELSTANPNGGGQLPPLEPWILGRYGLDVDPMGAGSWTEAGAGNSAGPVAGTGMVDSQMSASVGGSGAVVFGIAGRRTIAGDGSPQRLPVGIQTFGAELEWAAVPQVTPEVFRRARFAYNGALPLLPGPIASYVGADYVGSGDVVAIVPGETLKLSFGTDDRVKISRRLVSRQEEFIGVGRKTVRYNLKFAVEVSNFSDAPRTVEVVDQVPISENDRIVVKVAKIDPVAAEPRDGDAAGVLRWNVALQPGEKKTVIIEYSVSAPAESRQGALKAMQYLR